MVRLVAILVAVLALEGLSLAADVSRSQPNIVIFITDDESWQERSAYGWSNLPTPHFDRVAREGVLFTNGFASAPSCAPSRASLLTGRNFWELEEGAFIQAWLPAKFPVMPDLFEQAGYRVGFTGKGWGPGVPGDRNRKPTGPEYRSALRKSPEPGISPLDYAANLAAFLDTRKSGQPFWFWIGCVEPHAPCDTGNRHKLAMRGLAQDRIKLPGTLPDTPGIRGERADMLWEVCHADDDLGRILDVLEQRGELANTLLVVTSDNGTQTLRGKANLYDWGVHVPLAVMWPARAKAGRVVTDFVNLADVAPTCLEAAGLTKPDGMSGHSFLDVLEAESGGRVDVTRDHVVTGIEWHGEADPANIAGRMIRDDRWLYIRNFSQAPRHPLSASARRPAEEFDRNAATATAWGMLAKHPDHPAIAPFVEPATGPRAAEELYDLAADPWQTTNLAGRHEHAATLQRLRDQLAAECLRTGDPRSTGEMGTFERTRAFVLERKFGENGYATKALRQKQPAKR